MVDIRNRPREMELKSRNTKENVKPKAAALSARADTRDQEASYELHFSHAEVDGAVSAKEKFIFSDRLSDEALCERLGESLFDLPFNKGLSQRPSLV